MAGETIDIEQILDPEHLAADIGRKYDAWKNNIAPWLNEKQEMRRYVYATDTHATGTANEQPFANTVHLPKIAQIHDNLLANYEEALFPNDEWVNWEGGDFESTTLEKRRHIESYIRTKIKQRGLRKVFRECLRDWVLYGNCFAQVVYTVEKGRDAEGNETPKYIGPDVLRISPHDVVFNIAARNFEHAPKIVRRLYSMGELHKLAKTRPELGYTEDLIKDVARVRDEVLGLSGTKIGRGDIEKQDGYTADGFGNLQEYYESELIEVLEFYGSYYDKDKNEFHDNVVITILDRRKVVRNEPIESWHGSDYIHKSGWRSRPDSLLAQGPLDNLIGLQHKINKLENLRADVFDQIARPTIVETGLVEHYGNEGAYLGDKYVVPDGQGSVQYLRPDASALQADLQIAGTMEIMEQLAGAPKQAMGIRTPGEKTAFEVNQLETAASRIFQNKIKQFEEEFLEPILNDMLEIARRNLVDLDLVRELDPDTGAEIFLSITPEDLKGVGQLTPKGATHFAKRNQQLQVLLNVMNNPAIAQALAPHISRVRLGEVVEDLAGLEGFGLFSKNIGVAEDLETMQAQQIGQNVLDEDAITLQQIQAGELDETI